MPIPAHITTIFDHYPEYKLIETKDGIQIEYAEAFWPLAHPIDIELGAYRTNWQSNAFKHLKNAHHLVWPHLVPTWNDWSEYRFMKFCENWKITVWASGANVGKSHDAGCLALLFWWANCSQRTVLVGSTTITDLDNRIFGYMKQLHDIPFQNNLPVPGELYTSSPPKIIINKKDTIHGIYTIALLKGTSKSGSGMGKTTTRSSNLIGRHPKEGMLVIIDEGPDVSSAFIDAFPNWDKAPLFKCIVLGNSNSMYDPHGLLATPLDGWDSVSPDFDTEWVTKNGLCLYFDCYKSPAIYEKDPVKKELLSKFLFTEKSIQIDKDTYGENSHAFWRMTRGFWPPEDVSQTVLSPLTIAKHSARANAHWAGDTELIKLAALDPAFTYGGDKIILRFADLGKDINGRWLIDFGGKDYLHYITPDARSNEPIEYQIVSQAKALCIEANIPFYNIAIDTNGTGMGLGSIVSKEWSRDIMQVFSNGPCSDLKIADDKPTTAKEMYDRKVTELWFMIQRFILANQIRGLDEIACQQLCTRQYMWVSKKLSVEKKMDYKQRMGKVDSRYQSPDEGDSVALVIELVRHRFGLVPYAALNIPKKVDSGWRRYLDSKRVSDPPDENYIDNTFMDEKEVQGYNPNSWGDSFLHSDQD